MTQRHKVSKFCWKNGTDRLAWRRVATNLQLKKKMQYLRSTTKWSAIKQGLPVYTVWFHFCSILYMSERGRSEDKEVPHSMWTVLSKMLILAPPYQVVSLPSTQGSWKPSPYVTVCSYYPNDTPLGPPCFPEPFSKVISSPQNPNQHSLSVLQFFPVLAGKKPDLRDWH